ncbi:hypothetical protein J7394_19445 [Ruegeria sp. R13_0]|uniref:hypothetical protein n=1 Tax=Ruegeria sp. R13_0 TaxID=2821099 RepID=UPI001ADAE3AF|nr:hypothetical protein [Ruegeria sp. R13_0]MBO9436401.1 hypothetical protein [Ruegeria sp. R13_0]
MSTERNLVNPRSEDFFIFDDEDVSRAPDGDDDDSDDGGTGGTDDWDPDSPYPFPTSDRDEADEFVEIVHYDIA